MAKLKANAVISGLSGDLGKDHYARYTKDGQTIISKKPDFSNRQFSEAQLEVQSGMRAAAAYAKVASRVNPIYAEKAEGTSKNAYNLAVGDWLKGPVIRRIEWDEGHIRVIADDNVMVTRVTVTILSDEGKRLEQAEATTNQRVWWDYQATHRGLVRVEAWDFASNVTRQEFRPSSPSDCWRRTSRRQEPEA
jgi:hypothetical protein